MTYSVLTVGLPDKLIKALQALIFQYDLSFTSSATTREASRLLEQQVFHLLIIGLDYLKNIHQADWLTDIRRVSFVPLIVLSSTPDQDVNSMVHLGADMCISGKPPLSTIADHAYAQLRRYTEFNYYDNPASMETAPWGNSRKEVTPTGGAVKDKLSIWTAWLGLRCLFMLACKMLLE